MKHALLCCAVTLVATVAASAAAGAVVSGLVAGVAAGIVAGAVALLTGSDERGGVGTAGTGASDTAALDASAAETRLKEAHAANSQLRHDIRGALSPALLVSDRLTAHADPGVVKAGNIVVRAVERTTEILETNKQEDAVRMPITADGQGTGPVTGPARVSPPVR